MLANQDPRERLNHIRELVSREGCAHDWVYVEGATLCCQCGAGLEMILDDVRKISDPYAGGTRVAVTVDADQCLTPVPHAPSVMNALRTLPWWVWALVVTAGAVAGWAVTP